MITDHDTVHQLVSVLKLAPGERLILADGRGTEVEAEILAIDKDEIKTVAIDKYTNQNEPEREVVLYCAVLKRENFELAAHKAVETGVAKIVPVISEHTVKTGLNLVRVKKIIKEAAEISRRGRLPEIVEPMSFAQALTDAQKNPLTVFFDRSGKPWSVAEKLLKKEKQIGIFIGPEGGWSEAEKNAARDNKFLLVNLGRLNFKAETAVTLAVYLTVHI